MPYVLLFAFASSFGRFARYYLLCLLQRNIGRNNIFGYLIVLFCVADVCSIATVKNAYIFVFEYLYRCVRRGFALFLVAYQLYCSFEFDFERVFAFRYRSVYCTEFYICSESTCGNYNVLALIRAERYR